VLNDCAEIARGQARIADGFGLSFDHFAGRPSTQNKVLTQHFAAALYDQGRSKKSKTAQTIPKQTGRFLPDRYVRKAPAPTCGFGRRARRPVCATAPKQLDPEDLINPRSTGPVPRPRDAAPTKHLFCASRR